MKILFFDTESTGLISNTLLSLDKQPEVFEFYGYRADSENNYQMIDELHCFAKPTKPMEKGASRATGKKDSDFVNFALFSESAEKIKAFLESADLIVAHNVLYDVNIINFEMQRLGMKVNWPKVFCSVEQTEHIFGYRLSLTALHEYLFGETFGKAHTADSDVHALGRCYVELVKRGEI